MGTGNHSFAHIGTTFRCWTSPLDEIQERYHDHTGI